jgi:hypothetical protein
MIKRSSAWTAYYLKGAGHAAIGDCYEKPDAYVAYQQAYAQGYFENPPKEGTWQYGLWEAYLEDAELDLKPEDKRSILYKFIKLILTGAV